ncbi:MAG: serine/threonine-protein kinase [Planctomycetota bacterium]
MEGPIAASIPNFEIVSVIGQGAMGTVYLARWLGTPSPRMVALKVFNPSFAAEGESAEQLRREARAASMLKHPNIVQGIDFGDSSGVFYFAMEYVHGRTLQQILADEGALPERRALGIVRPVARALHHARRTGIVHRDIKPSNILVDGSGAVKLADFGLAKEIRRGEDTLSREGKTFGTPWYMSPEQARGEALDTRSDIYSLGVVLYRLLTGVTPYTGETVQEILSHCVEDPPMDPRRDREGISEAAAQLTLAMIQKARKRRLQTPDSVEGWIDAIIGKEG